MKRSIISLATLAVFLVIGGSARAGQISGLITFSGGNTASASDVNDNFTAVKTAVDDNYSRATTNATAITGKLSTSGGTVSGTLNVGTLAYVSPKTTYLSLSHQDLHPFQDGYDYSFYTNYLAPGTTGNYYFSGVNLPHGATVTQVDSWVWDTSTTYSVRAYLYRVSNTGTALAMADVSTAGSAGAETITDTSILYETIDNYNYSYMFRITFGGDLSNLRFYRARITYTVSAPD